MIRTSSLLAPLGALLLMAPAAVAAAAQSATPTVGELERVIDGGLRTIRAHQTEDGSYGGVTATALALVAFAESHRAYRPDDGPFVGRALDWLRSAQAPDGSVADDGAADESEWRQTLDALHAFQSLGEEVAAEAALRFLDIETVELAGQTRRHYQDHSTDALLDEAAALLALRDDASWGSVVFTASAVNELSAVHAILKTRKTPQRPQNATALPAFDPADAAATQEALERGARFLVGAAESKGRWGFAGQADPGITAMVTGALLSLPEPRPEDVQAAIQTSLDWLVSLQKPDGGIHAGQLANYVTSASVLALAAAERPGDAQVIARARTFLTGLQADEGEGYGPSDRYYGGVGYGGDERPDLSNLQMALDALAAAGLAEDDEAFQKALVFLQRCQNHSESNDFTLVKDGDTIKSGDDGGAGYAPGESKAGFVTLADGKKVPRSYGSMTYALLKGYLLAGLSKDDPRVAKAWEWLRRNYTLDVNPGFQASDDPTAAYQGLFYYFLAMARALDLYDQDVIEDELGRPHAWRKELSGRLIAMQDRDGSWVNDNAARWYEGNPVLATAYAMLTLGAALPE